MCSRKICCEFFFVQDVRVNNAGSAGDESPSSTDDDDDGGGTELKTDDFRTVRIVYPPDDDSVVTGIGFTLVGGNAKGVFVDAVDPASPAAKAGLHRGDQILAVDGRHIFGRTRDEVERLCIC